MTTIGLSYAVLLIDHFPIKTSVGFPSHGYIPITSPFFPVEIATFGHTQAPISIAGACVSCGYAGAEAMAQQHRIHGIDGADVDG